MTSDEETGGSPPCLACEMDEAYAGYLPPDELATALTRLMRLADLAPDAVRARWRAVLQPALARLPQPVGPAATAISPADVDLVEAARKLLPRIADDRLHATLKALVQP
ncbi:MAG TPA: hypothetical protein VKZ79_04215 [Alphaproteobacteria bacterium]|nr:hypothetical protein [Alphaproteobacteria bacterium]